MTWLWILLILILIVLLLWWLGRQEDRKPDSSKMAAQPPAKEEEKGLPDLVAVIPAEDVSAPAEETAPVMEMPETRAPQTPAPEVTGVENPVKGAEQAGAEIQPDDLRIIEGIGPKIAIILQSKGIVTFAQLAAADVSVLQKIMQENNLRIADPTTWPEQSRLAAEARWDDLKMLQDHLKGGRKVA